MQHHEPEALTERDLAILAGEIGTMEALSTAGSNKRKKAELLTKLQERYLYLEQRERDKGTGAS